MSYYTFDVEKLLSANPRLNALPRINDAALARIVEQVGPEHVPAGLNYPCLRSDLEKGFMLYRFFWGIRCSLSKRHFRKAIEKLYTALRQVSIALQPFENAAMRDELSFVALGLADREDNEELSISDLVLPTETGSDQTPDDLSQLFDELSFLVDASAEAVRRELKRPLEPPSPEPSPELYLIGECLPEIFERHFGPYKLVRSTVASPGIRFVLACLEWDEVRARTGKRYDPETIIKYRQRALSGNRASGQAV
jgi:hypothetical protein